MSDNQGVEITRKEAATWLEAVAADMDFKGDRDWAAKTRAVATLLTPTPASAGVLVEALTYDQLFNAIAAATSPITPGVGISVSVAAFRQALSATATPASDGVTAAADLPTDSYGMTVVDRMRDTAENGTMPPEYRKDLFALLDLATTPTPDRFGEGYRAGEWQDIASAPRDSDFLGWDETHGFYTVSFDYLFDDGTPRWSTVNWTRCHPTHWRPLPTAPSIRALEPDAGEGA